MFMVVRSRLLERSMALGGASGVGRVWFESSGGEVGRKAGSACAGLVLVALLAEGGFFFALLDGGSSCEFLFWELVLGRL